jgi:predicted DNA-binding mobile mystery protein A
MAKKMSDLRRSQLDRFFSTDDKLRDFKKPKSGWIKEIREALGMSLHDLADRLGVIKQNINQLERNEVSGKLTLASLEKAADALDCELVYFLVPRASLQSMVEEQALKSAKEIVKMTNTTMGLEDQTASKKSQELLEKKLASELLLKKDRRIWRIK